AKGREPEQADGQRGGARGPLGGLLALQGGEHRPERGGERLSHAGRRVDESGSPVEEGAPRLLLEREGGPSPRGEEVARGLNRVGRGHGFILRRSASRMARTSASVLASWAGLSVRQRCMRGKRSATPERWRSDSCTPSKAS